ncbi:hypothetical protein [Undibacterium sp.]|jgi:hypothetical protein|uniref:hypothetical protein n=1 Tax=Undibacterium sp. TaxID=1914977 RepID=UPI002B6F1F09|nr:hypothetical protein [Undibacterium sp.]HTD03147.1 hypothetical protein [Undibacterium sp.]
MQMLIDDGWQSHNRRQRLLAAVCAIALTVLLGQQLNGSRTYWQQHRLLDQLVDVKYLSILNLPPATPPENVAGTPSGIRSPQRLMLPAKPGAIQAAPAVASKTAEVPPDAPAPAEIAAEAARDTGILKLDGRSIAKAYKDSRSDMQKMADASGKTLAAQTQTRMQKFDAAMEQAAVPACLAQGEDPMKHNPPKVGGVSFSGLLVIPFYVEAIVKGKCK